MSPVKLLLQMPRSPRPLEPHRRPKFPPLLEPQRPALLLWSRMQRVRLGCFQKLRFQRLGVKKGVFVK